MKRSTVEPGCLYLVATPIGNLEDMTYRAVRLLAEVSLIAAEDTRKAQILLQRYNINTPTISFFEGNEQQRAPQLLARLRQGEAVAVISEAGMPGISDPGWRLSRCCIDEGLPIDVIPGPSAVTTALVLSGLPSARFRWIGFLPRKGRGRKALIASLQDSDDTTIIFEAPGRTAATLTELAEALGDRQAALTRELTKLHQEVLRASLPQLAAQVAEQRPRGEVTLVIGPAPETDPQADEQQLRQAVAELLADGISPRDIAARLGERWGKRRAYQLALALREDQKD